MSITVDGVVIQDCSGVDCDNINMVGVDADSTRVYTEVCYTPGEKIFYEDDPAWIVPSGVSSVTLCMIGGGGAGGMAQALPYISQAGGGYSGAIVATTVAVTEGSSIAIVCGLGGVGRTNPGEGAAGQPSKFGATTANGGLGGTQSIWDIAIVYPGNGNSRATCFGTFNDGNDAVIGNALISGGQAGFANGGSANAGLGLNGSGGGGSSEGTTSGAGGRGIVKVTW